MQNVFIVVEHQGYEDYKLLCVCSTFAIALEKYTEAWSDMNQQVKQWNPPPDKTDQLYENKNIVQVPYYS